MPARRHPAPPSSARVGLFAVLTSLTALALLAALPEQPAPAPPVLRSPAQALINAIQSVGYLNTDVAPARAELPDSREPPLTDA